jgi:5-(carboxyamino)imidazole ribonucleotide mutase
MSKTALRKDGVPVVGILTGSPSDLDVVTLARDALEELGIPCEVFVMSAHRTPERTVEYVKSARARGIETLIACAGMAAHLAGVVAAHTTLPVIGVPLASGKLDGMDSLLSTVQMPPGIPVATVGIDGSRNAAFLAARILSGVHPELHDRLEAQSAKDRAKYEAISVPTAARK